MRQLLRCCRLRCSLNGFRAKLISEPGLYKLIQSSNKPEAKRFDRWVRHEVLPAIRKDGAYVAGEEKVRTGELPEDEFVLRAMGILQAKVASITAERDAAEAARSRAEATSAVLEADIAVLEEAAYWLTVDAFRAEQGEYWDPRKGTASQLGNLVAQLTLRVPTVLLFAWSIHMPDAAPPNVLSRIAAWIGGVTAILGALAGLSRLRQSTVAAPE